MMICAFRRSKKVDTHPVLAHRVPTSGRIPFGDGREKLVNCVARALPCKVSHYVAAVAEVPHCMFKCPNAEFRGICGALEGPYGLLPVHTSPHPGH